MNNIRFMLLLLLPFIILGLLIYTHNYITAAAYAILGTSTIILKVKMSRDPETFYKISQTVAAMFGVCLLWSIAIIIYSFVRN